jgi:hypothetical protein
MNSERTTRNTGEKSDTTIASTDEPAGDHETPTAAPEPEREIGGRKGPDPTRYGDWEKGGRCIDF